MNLLEKYRAKLTSMKQDEERQESQAGLDEERRFRFEERAAIMEYDGGLTREEAERLARASLVNRVN